MFLRLLWESFARQRRRKLLAGIAILLGTTAVTAMLALATTIGDRIHRELAVYGANIVVYPKAEQLQVKIGGVDVKPATGGAMLKESDLEKLKTIFWANNITGVSPELDFTARDAAVLPPDKPAGSGYEGFSYVRSIPALGLWFDHPFGNGSATTGAPQLHPSWVLTGHWPSTKREIVLGSTLARQLRASVGSVILFNEEEATRDNIARDGLPIKVSGIVNSGDAIDNAMLVPLQFAQDYTQLPNAISRIDISARTKPEDGFARRDPDTMPAAMREIWYCRPYANSIAYQIQEAIPGSVATQVRRVEQTEGTVLERISGLMWLVSGAALLAAGFAVSAAMATAVLERRREIGLMRSLGASKSSIAMLFYAESGLLAVAAGTVGYLAGSLLAFWLGARIFPGDGATPLLNFVLLPVVVAMALIVAFAGSTPSIRKALEMDPSAVLRVDA